MNENLRVTMNVKFKLRFYLKVFVLRLLKNKKQTERFIDVIEKDVNKYVVLKIDGKKIKANF